MTIHIMVPGVSILLRVSVVLHSLQQGVTRPPVIPIAPVIMHWPATQSVKKRSHKNGIMIMIVSARLQRSYYTRGHSPPVSLIIIDGLWLAMSVLGLPVLPRVMIVTTELVTTGPRVVMVAAELLPGPVIAELACVVTLAVLRALD